MPLLPYVVGSYLNRVKDSLRYGTDPGARASASIGTGGLVHIEVKAIGEAGNDYTVTVTSPAGTAGLTVSLSGKDITVALAVSSGVPVSASNTSLLIAKAINAAVSGVTARVMDNGAGVLSAAESLQSFSGGADSSVNNVTVSIPGYLRAQDLASALDLLQDGLDTGSMTVVSGTTRTLVDGAATFTAGQQVGNVVTFTGNTTAALAGVTARVKSNTTTTLTFEDALPAAPAAGDTYSIRGGLVDVFINKLRDGRGAAEAPAGSVYGDTRHVLGALYLLIQQLGGTVPTKQVSRPGLKAGSGSTTSVVVSSDTDMKIDQFKGMTLTISGETRRIVSNNENSFTLAKALTSAPAAATSFTVQLPTSVADQFPGRFNLVHPGGHPDAAVLADLIDKAQVQVEAYVVPT